MKFNGNVQLNPQDLSLQNKYSAVKEVDVLLSLFCHTEMYQIAK